MMKTVYSTHIVYTCTCIWLLELQILKIDTSTCIFNFSALYFEYNWNNNHKLQIPYVHDGKKYSTYKTLTIDAWNALLLKNIEKSSKNAYL